MLRTCLRGSKSNALGLLRPVPNAGLFEKSKGFRPFVRTEPYDIRRFSRTAGNQEESQRKFQSGIQNAAKKRSGRVPGPKTSLRRVAVEAERSMDGAKEERAKRIPIDPDSGVKIVTAYCAAERYNIATVSQIMESVGFTLDPARTALYPHVVHVQYPAFSLAGSTDNSPQALGDVFVFPSGQVVAWDVGEDTINTLVSKGLLPAAENPHLNTLETEDLEFVEDPLKEKSNIVGERISLGTRQPSTKSIDDTPTTSTTTGNPNEDHSISNHRETNLILDKIAFSSGLARSAKLAVLESALERYFDSTRSIPSLLSKGSKLPFTRDFILRKTGELMAVRAQLNLYSELTDSLPDLFWDSRHELGLEGHFDRVGRALDVNARIKTLNQKMDYAQEIATVLRERLSEKHGLFLEWVIIWLIAAEVAFGTWHLWEEQMERSDPGSLKNLSRRYYEQALAEEE